MRDHSLIHLLLLLLLGVFLLTQYERLPHVLFYGLMLAVLGGTRLLAPEWFEQRWFTLLWRVCVGVALAGLLLEGVSQLMG